MRHEKHIRDVLYSHSLALWSTRNLRRIFILKSSRDLGRWVVKQRRWVNDSSDNPFLSREDIDNHCRCCQLLTDDWVGVAREQRKSRPIAERAGCTALLC